MDFLSIIEEISRQQSGRPLLTVYHNYYLARVVNTEIQVNTMNAVGLHGAVVIVKLQ